MNTWLIVGMIALGLAAGTGAEGKAPVWHTDYAQARELARRTDKPLFVVLRCER